MIGRKIELLRVLVAANVSFAGGVARKLIEARTYDYGWQADMAALDLLSNALHDEAATTGYIIIYGAKRGRRGEVERRMQSGLVTLRERPMNRPQETAAFFSKKQEGANLWH